MGYQQHSSRTHTGPGRQARPPDGVSKANDIRRILARERFRSRRWRTLLCAVLLPLTFLSVTAGASLIGATAADAAGLSCPGSYNLCIPPQGANEGVTGTAGKPPRRNWACAADSVRARTRTAARPAKARWRRDLFMVRLLGSK